MRAILTYHSIDGSGSPISLDEPTFERHVRFFASGRVRVLPLADLLAAAPTEDAVSLTFDDGFRNFATAAWPRLRDSGLPATLFVVTERIGLDNRWGGRDDPSVVQLDLLDWDELGNLGEQGVDIGSHSRSHAVLPALGTDAIVDEIAGSADDIERHTGRRPTTFCYPFGSFDERVAEVATAVYRRACTTQLRPLRSSELPHRLPRLDCYYLRSSGRLERWGTGRLRWYLGARAAGRRVRAALPKRRSAR